MQFGIFHIPHDLTAERDYREVVGEMRELAKACDQSGFDVFWIAEHHFSVWGRELCPNPILLASDVAARTERLRVGLAAAIITFWHPLRLAEDVATLDHLADGRLEVGVGRGNYGLEATNLNPAANPNNPQENFNVFNETLQILKKALSEERFSHKGALYEFPAPGFSADMAHTVDDPRFADPETGELVKITTLPHPHQKPHPPMWVVVNSDLSIQHAAENGCGIIMWRPPNATLKQRIDHYRESWARSGDGPHGPRTAVMRDTFVADSEDQAREIAGEAAMGALNFANWRGPYIYLNPGEELDEATQAAQTKELSFDFVKDRSLLFGSPDDVTDKLIAMHRETGIDQVSFKTDWPGLEHRHALRSVERLRDDVIPRVRQAIAADKSVTVR
mgnify:CR=1 FL=1|tara:strand:+ start:4529 stop:5701 length:1173 start_codon:yes stop_codon:yes gene_type:complete